jgi:hypothetical protein
MQAKLITVAIFVLFSTSSSFGQNKGVTISGLIKDKVDKSALSYVSVTLKTEKDSAFIAGTVSNEDGRFTLTNIQPNNYYFEIYLTGYITKRQAIYVGSLSEFLDIATIDLEKDIQKIAEVSVMAKQDDVSGKMEKKTFKVEDNISQSGGSILQSMQNLPGVNRMLMLTRKPKKKRNQLVYML